MPTGCAIQYFFNNFAVSFNFQTFLHVYYSPTTCRCLPTTASYAYARAPPYGPGQRQCNPSLVLLDLWWFGLLVSFRSDFRLRIKNTGKCFWLTKPKFGFVLALSFALFSPLLMMFVNTSHEFLQLLLAFVILSLPISENL